MKFKLIIAIGLLLTSTLSLAENCLTDVELTKAITTDKLVEPTGKCKPTDPTNTIDADKAFVGSKDTTSYKTNAVMEGYVGFTDGVVKQGTAPLEVLPEVTDYTKKITQEAKQSIQMDTEESSAYKAGVTLGTVAVIGLGYMGIKHSAKKETDEMLKPLKEGNDKLLDSNTKLLESNAKLEAELKEMKDATNEMKDAKLNQYKVIESQRKMK